MEGDTQQDKQRQSDRLRNTFLAYSEEESEIGLLYIYDKSERETLSDAELTELLRRNEIL